MDKNEILNSDWYVRVSVAENPSTPVDVLTELAKDSDWEVRVSVAENTNTPADVLMKLAESGNSVVRKNAAGNPQHSRWCVERISKR